MRRTSFSIHSKIKDNDGKYTTPNQIHLESYGVLSIATIRERWLRGLDYNGLSAPLKGKHHDSLLLDSDFKAVLYKWLYNKK